MKDHLVGKQWVLCPVYHEKARTQILNGTFFQIFRFSRKYRGNVKPNIRSSQTPRRRAKPDNAGLLCAFFRGVLRMEAFWESSKSR